MDSGYVCVTCGISLSKARAEECHFNGVYRCLACAGVKTPRPRPTAHCAQCGKEFVEGVQNAEGAKFCDVPCASEWAKANAPLPNAPVPAKDVCSARIAAICSVPRLGWQDHFGSVQRALHPLGIQVAWYTTAFWHKGISKAIKDCLNADWILSLDYDTVFDHIHAKQLIKVFQENPTFDALAAMQPRRGTGAPLMVVKDATGKKVAKCSGNEPVKAYTAHFGFTLFRTAALRTFPKPWFNAIPDADGEWGDLCTDPDIDFWKKWSEAGKTLYVDPRIRVGHLEVLVSYQDEHMQQHYMPVSEWRAKHPDEWNNSIEQTETRG